MSRTMLMRVALVGGLAILSTQAGAQYAAEIEEIAPVETRPLVEPYTGAPIVERRVIERRVIVRPAPVIERRYYREPSYEDRWVDVAPRPPARVVGRRVYEVGTTIDNGDPTCRTIVRRTANEFGELVERRALRCD